jgi:hypothetical protein
LETNVVALGFVISPLTLTFLCPNILFSTFVWKHAQAV